MTTTLTTAKASGVATDGTNLYVALWSNETIDVYDPADIGAGSVGSATTSSAPYGLAVFDDYVAVATFSDTVDLFDCSDSANPTLAESISVSSSRGFGGGNDVAFVLSSSGVRILNVGAPPLIDIDGIVEGSFTEFGGRVNGMDVQNGRLFLPGTTLLPGYASWTFMILAPFRWLPPVTIPREVAPQSAAIRRSSTSPTETNPTDIAYTTFHRPLRGVPLRGRRNRNDLRYFKYRFSG